jgi:adenylate kinase
VERQIVFVGGIHGVGKTQFCRTLIKHLHFDHVTASELIRKYKKLPISEQKQVVDVEENQDILIQSLNIYESSSKTLLLDGHFCLLGPKFEIQKIPIITFERISPKAVIVFIEEAEVIKKRLMDRDNVPYNLDLIKEFQVREIEHAKYVCKLLGLPQLVVNPNTGIDDTIAFLQKHASK